MESTEKKYIGFIRDITPDIEPKINEVTDLINSKIKELDEIGIHVIPVSKIINNEFNGVSLMIMVKI